MDEYGNIYYVGDARNALVNDHRTIGSPVGGLFGTPVVARPPVPASVPPRPPAYVPPPQPAQVTPAQPVLYTPPTWNPNVWAQPAYNQPVYTPPGYWNQGATPSLLGSLFGGMHAGQVISLVADALAAFRSLPAAPAPTAELTTDVANSVIYDKALAQHAKTDEQIRTIGHLVAKLVR
jgi:hypothetical protein